MIIQIIQFPFKKAAHLINAAYQKTTKGIKAVKETWKIVKPTIKRSRLLAVFVPVSLITLTISEYLLYRYSMQKTVEGSNGVGPNEVGPNEESSKKEPPSFVQNTVLIFGHLLGTVVIRNLQDGLARFAGHHLSNSLKRTVINQRLSNRGVPIGINFLQDQEKMRDPNNKPVTFHQVMLNCNNLGDPFYQGTMTVVFRSGSMMINLFYLRQLFSYVNNAKVFVGAGLLGIGFTRFLVWIGDRFEKSIQKEGDVGELIQNQFQHLEEHYVEIAALQGEQFEAEKLCENYDKYSASKKNSTETLFYFQSANDLIYHFFATMMELIIPTLLKTGQVNYYALVFMQRSVTNFVFSLKEVVQILTQSLPSLTVAQDKFIQYQKLLSDWEKFVLNRELKVTYDQPKNEFVLQEFNVHIPKAYFDLKTFADVMKTANLLKKTHLRLKMGKIYKLSGNSGAGKTTLLKAILGLFPCTKGSIAFPCKPHEIHFLSQNVVIPHQSTLLEAIYYPERPSLSPQKTRKLESLMADLGLKEKIKDLNITKAWAGILSGGEKRRICLLRALVKADHIKVLILDEPCVGLDFAMRKEAHQLIRHYFSHALVIYTEHEHDEEKEVEEMVCVLNSSNSSSDAVQLHSSKLKTPDNKEKVDTKQKAEKKEKFDNTENVDNKDKIELLYSYLRLRRQLRQEFFDKEITIDPKKRQLQLSA